MKLTPEQKAILAYGEARGILKERKSLMRFTEGSGRQDMQKLRKRIQLSPLFSMLEMLAQRRRRTLSVPVLTRQLGAKKGG